jgi:DNA-binding MarR family transcriptional regulator
MKTNKTSNPILRDKHVASMNKCPYCKHKFINTELKSEFWMLKILKNIREQKEIHTLSLKQNFGLSYATMIGIVEKNVKRGFIKRFKKTSKLGRFSYMLKLTPKGKELLRDLK